ncbi:MAG: hypothetical protein GF401_00175 [Chitinivibrionales bacterium]|nr:hypothetical protein [Chitinivibrionales bacterium]
MPGITGIISKKNPEARDNELNTMLNCMLRDNDYATGRYVYEPLGIYVGWAAHKGAFDARMPIISESEDVALVFSGEEFHAKSSNILHPPSRNREQGDASYLVRLYEDNPGDFFSSLNGWFSGLLIDMRRGRAYLFNDRYCMHRIHYHETSDAFYFASEAKSLLALFPELRRIDEKGLGEYLRCGTPLENRTIFSGLSYMPGGSRWIFTGKKKPKKKKYFRHKGFEQTEILSPDDFYMRLKELFPSVVNRYLQEPGKTGISLTGGLDTRRILACEQLDSGAFPCYTFAGPYREPRDSIVARQIAGLCNQPHHALKIEDDFFDNFESLASETIRRTDGCLDVSGAAELYMNTRARDIAPIRLTGNYGSEILKGYRPFGLTKVPEAMIHPDLAKYISLAENTFAAVSQCTPLTFIAFKQMPWYSYGRRALEQSVLTMRSPYLDNDLIQMAYAAPLGMLTNETLSLRLIRELNPTLAGVPTDRGLYAANNGLLNKARRIPAEFSFKMEYLANYGMPPSMTVVDRFLRPLQWERMFLGRHKYYHYRIWLRDQLADYVKSILLDPQAISRPYIKTTALEKTVMDHCNGKANNTSEILTLLSLELLNRELIERW